MAPRLILPKAQKSTRGHATYSAETGMLAGYVEGTLAARVAAEAVSQAQCPVGYISAQSFRYTIGRNYMNQTNKHNYARAGYVASIFFLLALLGVVILIALAMRDPQFKLTETFESMQILLGLSLLLGWFSIIGCYAIVCNKTRVSTYLRFWLFPPFALYAVFILFVKGGHSTASHVGILTATVYAFRAAIGWD